MSWFKKSERSFLESIVIRTLKTGQIPKHVAFIMDGNRRYANKNHLDSVNIGHLHGFDKLTHILGWCDDMGIQEVTVYAFSIENFKRPKEEVTNLMTLAEEKFQKLLEEKDKLREQGVRIKILGDLKLLPLSLQKLLAEVELMTRDHKRAFLNVCFAYTSRQEMTSAIKDLVEARINPDLITEEFLRRCFWSGQCSDPDLVVRTSGEIRLSDFLLWQSGFSVLCFVERLWPEFSIWDLFKAVFFYQRHCQATIRWKDQHEAMRSKQPLTEEQQSFLEKLYSQREEYLRELIEMKENEGEQ